MANLSAIHHSAYQVTSNKRLPCQTIAMPDPTEILHAYTASKLITISDIERHPPNGHTKVHKGKKLAAYPLAFRLHNTTFKTATSQLRPSKVANMNRITQKIISCYSTSAKCVQPTIRNKFPHRAVFVDSPRWHAPDSCSKSPCRTL